MIRDSLIKSIKFLYLSKRVSVYLDQLESTIMNKPDLEDLIENLDLAVGPDNVIMCGDCSFLQPKEQEQHAHKDLIMPKGKMIRNLLANHMCVLYNQRIYHMANHHINHHPQIHKCSQCLLQNRRFKTKMFFITKDGF